MEGPQPTAGTAEICQDQGCGHCWAGLFQTLEVQSPLPVGTGVLVEGSRQRLGQDSEGGRQELRGKEKPGVVSEGLVCSTFSKISDQKKEKYQCLRDI